MLSEEQKAIRNLENLSEFGLSTTLNQTDLDKMKIVLNLIEELKEENISLFEDLKNWKKLNGEKNRQLLIANKQIDLMAEVMYKSNTAQLLIEYGIENKEQLIKEFEKLAKEKGE